ncbi:MAG: PHP domain-containing protein [Mycoplasma sp.]|nr:PHP domain-containing protein [Candidatus Hennigella equi]
MLKNIFHIHTYICKHSTNKIEEIVAYALKHGYKKLYFTEHPYITVDCPYQQRRADKKDVINLSKQIDMLNKKYKNKLKIYFGYEVEYNKANRWYIHKLAKDPYCKFLIFGNHFYGDLFKIQMPLPLVVNVTKNAKQLKEFDENNIAAFKSGLMSWVAHPDIYLNSYQKWDATAKAVANNIIKYATKYKLPLGFNVNFKSYENKSKWHYPCKYFWQLVAKTNIPVIIEADSHDMHTLKVDWLAKAKKLAISYGLKKNLTENIKLKKLKKAH